MGTLEGIREVTYTLTPGQTQTIDFVNPILLGGTVLITNTANIASTTELDVYMLNVGDMVTTTYSLNQGRYGLQIANKPLSYIQFTNKDTVLNVDISFKYLIAPMQPVYDEEIIFITQVQEAQPPLFNVLFSGTNLRYNGSLAGATFFSGMPNGTKFAFRQINVLGTSSSAVGIAELIMAENLEFHQNVSPLGAVIFSEIYSAPSDDITKTLVSTATQTNCSINRIIVDYDFEYSLTITFPSYTISSGSIVVAGDVNLFYYTGSTGLASEPINSISGTNSSYTISPTSGTTNSSGQLAFTMTQALTPTANLTNTVSASTIINGISENGSLIIGNGTIGFDFTLSSKAPVSSAVDVGYSPTAGGSLSPTGGTAMSQSVSTAGTNELIYVVVGSLYSNDNSHTISISDTSSLTWTRRYHNDYIYDATNNMTYSVAIFYAVATAQLAGDTITATDDQAYCTMNMGITCIKGFDSTNPFIASPAVATGFGTPSGNQSVSITSATIQQITLGCIYGYAITDSMNASSPTGFTSIATTGSSTFYFLATEYANTSASTTITYNNFTGAWQTWIEFADAVNLNPNTTAIATVQATPVGIENQTVNYTLSGSGSASFSSSNTVLTTTAATDASGNASVDIYKSNGTNSLSVDLTIAGIAHNQTSTV